MSDEKRAHPLETLATVIVVVLIVYFMGHVFAEEQRCRALLWNANRTDSARAYIAHPLCR